VPAPAPGGKGRVESLDMLRGLMALAVAVYHFTTWYPTVFEPGRFAAYTAAKAGHYAVEGFFIISGFCFFYLYGPGSFRGKGFRNFHIKRFLRIAPLYYVAVAANLILGLSTWVPSRRILLENATLTFGLFHPNHSLVLGGWSIGIEYVFYLAFPLLAWAAWKFRPFLFVGAVGLIFVSMFYTLYAVPMAPRAGEQNFHLYVQVGNHAFLFLLGGLAAQARVRIPWRLTALSFTLLAGALGAAFCLRYRNFYDHFVIMEGIPRYYFAGLCFAVVALFAFREFPDSLAKRAGVFLGEISYSVYLLHPFAQEALKAWAPAALPPVLGWCLGLILTLALATVTHRWVERPAMEWGKRLTAR